MRGCSFGSPNDSCFLCEQRPLQLLRYKIANENSSEYLGDYGSLFRFPLTIRQARFESRFTISAQASHTLTQPPLLTYPLHCHGVKTPQTEQSHKSPRAKKTILPRYENKTLPSLALEYRTAANRLVVGQRNLYRLAVSSAQLADHQYVCRRSKRRYATLLPPLVSTCAGLPSS